MTIQTEHQEVDKDLQRLLATPSYRWLHVPTGSAGVAKFTDIHAREFGVEAVDMTELQVRRLLKRWNEKAPDVFSYQYVKSGEVCG